MWQPMERQLSRPWFYKEWRLSGIGNHILEIRQSYSHLINTVVRWHLYIESAPWWSKGRGNCINGFWLSTAAINLDHRFKRPWLRSQLFCGAIDLDLQGQIQLNLPHFELVRTVTQSPIQARITKFGPEVQNTMVRTPPPPPPFFFSFFNHCITTREPWVPRVLTVSWFSSSACTDIPRPFHSLVCLLSLFTVSTLCTYTDLGSRGHFGA